jgi:hypothetical protein
MGVMPHGKRNDLNFKLLLSLAIAFVLFTCEAMCQAGSTCERSTVRDGRVWSSDCHAYFLNEATRPLNGKAERFAPQTITVSSRNDAHGWLVGDPTKQIRREIAQEVPACVTLRIDISGVTWLDSEHLLITTNTSCAAKEGESRMYALDIRSGASKSMEPATPHSER